MDGLLALRLGVVALLRGGLLGLVQLALDAIFRLFGLLCLLHFSGGTRSRRHGSAGQPAARAQGGERAGEITDARIMAVSLAILASLRAV